MSLNKQQIAEDFVNLESLIARRVLGACLSKNNSVEFSVRTAHNQECKKLNTLRLLVLTNNLSETDYLTQCIPIIAEIDKLSLLIWPESEANES
jgi:hypothetical protein